MNFCEYIRLHNVISDGSFGTYYAEKYQTQEPSEAANTLHPERVTEIHSEYLKAGASLIRTNTYASNTAAMQSDISAVRENITSAVILAKSAVEHFSSANREIFIAGAIGPIDANGSVNYEGIEREYYDIARCLAENGVSVISFETFPDLEHIIPAIKKIKAEYNVFVITSFSVNQLGYSSCGLHARNLLTAASEIDAVDAVGLNCGIGPAHMYDILKKTALPKNKYVLALPNAGYPILSRSRVKFDSQPAYFAEKAAQLLTVGADIIGGCCGTNPIFIKHITETVDIGCKPQKSSRGEAEALSESIVRRSFIYDEKGNRKNKKLIAVELAPPFNADDEKLLESAHILKNADVDVLTFPDSPSGRTRVDSVLMAEKVYRETGIAVMPHICCRDKNALAMRSLFMGAKINDINNFLIITGDPVPSESCKTVKSVFNFDSVGLMKILRDMNRELFSGSPLIYGGAVNQNRKNPESVINRVKAKMNAGAEFFLTQPIFTREEAERLRLIKKETDACILCGIMPLVSRKNALFMKNEIAGVNVTEEIAARYPENASKAEGEAVGIALAKEIITMVEDFADGYYFSFPFNRVYMLDKIMNN